MNPPAARTRRARERTVLHPRLDLRGRPVGATTAILGHWDALVLMLLASHPDFDPHEFAWASPERLGDGVLCVSIYTDLAADSPYLWITQLGENPETYRLYLYVGGADGEEAEDPFLVADCGADELGGGGAGDDRLGKAARGMRGSGR